MGMDVNGREPKNAAGEYFRANVWSWRPLLSLIIEANALHGVGIDEDTLHGMGYNDGIGLEDQFMCDRLADALHKVMSEPPKTLEMVGDRLEKPSDMRISHDGTFLPRGTSRTEGESAYSITQEHVARFIVFLRGCGGFEVW